LLLARTSYSIACSACGVHSVTYIHLMLSLHYLRCRESIDLAARIGFSGHDIILRYKARSQTSFKEENCSRSVVDKYYATIPSIEAPLARSHSQWNYPTHITHISSTTDGNLWILFLYYVIPVQRWAPGAYNPRALGVSLGISAHRTDLVQEISEPDRDRARTERELVNAGPRTDRWK
jgi:hypothetical protein